MCAFNPRGFMEDVDFLEVMEVKPKTKGTYLVSLWDYGNDGGLQQPPKTYYHKRHLYYNGISWRYEKENVLVCFIAHNGCG